MSQWNPLHDLVTLQDRMNRLFEDATQRRASEAEKNDELERADWYPAAEQAIGALFVLHPTPEQFLADVAKSMYAQAFGVAVAKPTARAVESAQRRSACPRQREL